MQFSPPNNCIFSIVLLQRGSWQDFFKRKRITFVAVLSSFVHHCAYALGWFYNRKKLLHFWVQYFNSYFRLISHSYVHQEWLSVQNITLLELFKFQKGKVKKISQFYNFLKEFWKCCYQKITILIHQHSEKGICLLTKRLHWRNPSFKGLQVVYLRKLYSNLKSVLLHGVYK